MHAIEMSQFHAKNHMSVSPVYFIQKPLLREEHSRTILMHLTRQKYYILARALESAEMAISPDL